MLLGCAAPAPTPGAQAAEAAPNARTPRPPRRPPTVYTPVGPGARVYEAAPLPADRAARRLPGTEGLPELEAGLVEVVREVARAAGRPAPVPDPRAHKVAADLARNSRGMRPPPSDIVRFLANFHGVIEADPAIYTLVGPAHVPSVLEQYRRSLGKVWKRGDWNRLGVASLKNGDELTVVVTLWEQLCELRPVPRELPSEGRAPLAVRLLGKFSNPQLVVTLPGGQVRALPVTIKDGSLRSELRCIAGDGRYQLEILASGSAGPAVLGNFPVFCGVRAPDDASAYEEDDVEHLDPAEAEQELLALINQARLAAGLRELAWDNRLAAIARAHSRDMANAGFVAHVSPTTGDAVARVQRAGLAFRMVVENVGQEGGVQQAHRGFMASPGHRANVLNAQLTKVGIGVVIKKGGGGAPLLVTELFTAD